MMLSLREGCTPSEGCSSVIGPGDGRSVSRSTGPKGVVVSCDMSSKGAGVGGSGWGLLGGRAREVCGEGVRWAGRGTIANCGEDSYMKQTPQKQAQLFPVGNHHTTQLGLTPMPRSLG